MWSLELRKEGDSQSSMQGREVRSYDVDSLLFHSQPRGQYVVFYNFHSSTFTDFCRSNSLALQVKELSFILETILKQNNVEVAMGGCN